MFTDIPCLLADLGILYFVMREYYESRETNRVLLQVLNKQRKQKQRVSVDKIIKAVSMESK